MAEVTTPHFVNDAGVDTIEIGVKEFQCMGAKPPFDHPHIFLDMGSDHDVLCPYCSTRYVYKAELASLRTRPDGCLFDH